MSLTLAQAALLSQDKMIRGIGLTIVKDCPFFEMLPFEEIVGNSLLYNLESAEADARFYQVGDIWVESTPTWGQRSAAIVNLGGDADVDNFIATTRSNVNNIAQTVIELKAKAIRYKFMKELIVGGTTTTPASGGFEGILQLIAECESLATVDLDAVNNSQVVAAAADSGALTLTLVDELMDRCLGGKPDMLMMSKRARRKLTNLCRVGGSMLDYASTELGQRVERYAGVPIVLNDFLPDNFQDGTSSVLPIASYVQTQARASGYDNTIILALRLGADALTGLQAGGGLQVVSLGDLETKDAKRTRLKWYCGLALLNIKVCAALINVNPDS